MRPPGRVLDGSIFAQIVWPHRNLAMAAGEVEDVGGLAEAGNRAAKAPKERPAFGEGCPKVRSAGGEVRLVKIVGLYPCLYEGAHQLCQSVRVVVDTPKEHGLTQHRNARVDQPGARSSGLEGKLARMVGV